MLDFDITFLTSRHLDTEQDTIDSLEDVGLGHIPLLFSKKIATKAEVIVDRFPICVFIDDRPEFIQEVTDQAKDALCIYFNSQNLKVPEKWKNNNRIVITTNWWHVLTTILKWQKQN